MKRCFKCNRDLPASEFYRHPAMADGLLGKCKECARADVRRNYANRREYYHEYEAQRAKTSKRRQQASHAVVRQRLRAPHKNAARNAVNNAVRDGRLRRLPCEMCGSLNTEAHHSNYHEPLEVTWLCFKHHREVHGQTVSP